MTQATHDAMHLLYGRNIWDEFEATAMVGDVQGWNGHHPSLSRLSSLPGPKIVVDVGVWKGLSTITMANAMKAGQIDGVVIAVDTFLGSIEHWSSGHELFGRQFGMPDLYRTFLSNVSAAGLCDFVVPLPQTASTACKLLRQLGIQPSIVHVDAAHDYRDVLQDVEDYWSILRDNGYLIGDDYHETWPGVVRAAGEFSAKVNRPLTIEPPKFILQKKI